MRLSIRRLNQGFGIIDSMVALGLLASIAMLMLLHHVRNTRYKDARQLASQTEIFATTFARYMNNTTNFNNLVKKTNDSSVTVLNPLTLGDVWPKDLAKQNLFKQTPCVAVMKNSNTGDLEAIMYYVGGVKQGARDSIKIAQNAAVLLGGKGGVLNDDGAAGNSGFFIKNSSPFLTASSECHGGALSKNSLVVNMDLLFDWNQNLEPAHSIFRSEGKATGGTVTLPGHLQNANTVKTNLYLDNDNGTNTGVIFDNSSSNLVKLAVVDKSNGSVPTLGVVTNGDHDKTSTLIGDTIQIADKKAAGAGCGETDLGKVVTDLGMGEGSAANNVLARSTLVCTKNEMLCGDKHQCYLPSISNSIKFQNNTNGIQDVSGSFECPLSVPFATNVTTAVTHNTGNVYVFHQIGDFNTLNLISALIGYSDKRPPEWQKSKDSNVPLYRQILLADFTKSSQGFELLGIDLDTIEGKEVTAIKGNNMTLPTAQPKNKSLHNYQVTVGYQIDLSYGGCNYVCSQLDRILKDSWQQLGTKRKDDLKPAPGSFQIKPDGKGCGCERKDFVGNYYSGIAAIITNATPQPIISSVTCSNMPVYNQM